MIAGNGERIPAVVHKTQIGGEWFAAQVMGATELVQTEQDFQKLAGGLLSLYDEERRRIARELHNTTTQNLAALSMNLTMLTSALQDAARGPEILRECESLTEECLEEIRSLSYLLHPPLLDELGLETTLRAFIGLYQRRTGVLVNLVLRGQLGRFAPGVELAAFRIVQEGLLNIERHSGSKHAEVCLTRHKMSFELAVRDWGKGVPASVQASKSVGITGMRERVRLLAGRLEIVCADPGTIVRAHFPMES